MAPTVSLSAIFDVTKFLNGLQKFVAGNQQMQSVVASNVRAMNSMAKTVGRILPTLPPDQAAGLEKALVRIINAQARFMSSSAKTNKAAGQTFIDAPQSYAQIVQLLNGITGSMSNLGSVAQSTGTKVSSSSKSIINALGGVGNSVYGPITQATSKMQAFVGTATKFQSTISGIMGAVQRSSGGGGIGPGSVLGGLFGMLFGGSIGGVGGTAAGGVLGIPGLTGGASIGLAIGATIGGALDDILKGITQTVSNVIGGISKTIGDIIGGILKTLGTLMTGIGRAALGAVVGVADFVGWILKIAGAQFAVDVLEGIVRWLEEIPPRATEAVSYFQQMQIRLQMLASGEYVKKFGGTYEQALTKVEGNVKSLLAWIKKIAVTTPFTAQAVSDSLMLARGLGFSSTQAEKLILDIGNMAAGMGLTDEAFQRIMYDFGQIMSMNRVNGREIQNLSYNLVPVKDILDILAEKYKKGRNEIRDMLLTGKISAQEFIQTFMDIAEERFPNAMQKMSRTLSRVILNWEDFFDIAVGWEVLAPVMTKVTNILADALEAAMSPNVLQWFKVAGMSINTMFDTVANTVTSEFMPALKSLFKNIGVGDITLEGFIKTILNIGFAINATVHFIARLVDVTGRFLKDVGVNLGGEISGLIPKMFSWGANIVISFAKGMISAITWVVKAITSVVKFISGLLKAKSPPKALPEIGLWGAKTMEAYLEGFGNANYSILNNATAKITPMLAKYQPPSVVDQGIEPYTPPSLYAPARNEALELTKTNSMVKTTSSTVASWLPTAADFLRWGADAMTSYLKGFANADFSVFKEISSTVSSYLKSLVGIGQMGETIEIPTLLDFRTNLISVLKDARTTGQIGTINIPMGLSDEINDYIKELVNMEAITSQVTNANVLMEAGERILTDTMGDALNVFGLSVDSVGDLQDAIGLFTGGIQTKVSAYVDSLSNLRAANEAVEISQTELTRVTEFYDTKLKSLNDALNALTEQYDEQQRLKILDKTLSHIILTADERERLETEKKSIILKAQIRATEQERDISVKSSEEKLTSSQKAQKEAQRLYDIQKQNLTDIMKLEQDSAQARIDYMKNVIDIAVENNNLLAEQAALVKRIADAAAGAGEEESNFSIGEIDDTALDELEAMSEALGKTVDTLKNQLSADWAAIMAPLDLAFSGFEEALLGTYTHDAGTGRYRQGGLIGAFNTLQLTLGDLNKVDMSGFTSVFDTISTAWEENDIPGKIERGWRVITDIVNGNWPDIVFLAVGDSPIVKFFVGVGKKLTGNRNVYLEGSTDGIIPAIFSNILGMFTSFGSLLKNVGARLLSNIFTGASSEENMKVIEMDLWNFFKSVTGLILGFNWNSLGGQIINGIINGILGKKDALIAIIEGTAGATAGAFKKTSKIDSPSKVYENFGANLMKGLELGILKNIPLRAMRTVSNIMTTSIDRSIHINVNANYPVSQSPVGIRYDVTAALAYARL